MKKSFFLALVFVAVSTFAYTPVQGHIMTTWGENITPENAWRNYPRPNFERDNWECLNGLWQFAVTPMKGDMPKDNEWQQEILVPFAPEAALSGVGRLTEPNENLWYKRTFNLPTVEEGKRYFLNFEAVDWRSQVFVNGKEATIEPHIGGNVPFTVEVTDFVKAGENILVVSAWDPSNTENQPTGKQSINPHGCFYTRVSGIYGSVWLETTPKAYLKAYNVVSDIDAGTATISVECGGDLAGSKVTAEIYFGEKKIGETEITSWQKGATVKIPEPKLWDINQPNLYTLILKLSANDQVDEVKGYFGLRKIEYRPDERGVERIYLNGRKVFLQGTLDQGWWPDGLLTPPSDEAIQYDIQILKDYGFNFMRKHIKIEPRRYYYLCDLAGFPIWQDMVSGGAKAEEFYHYYRSELKDMLATLKNFPCILTWIPYNEGWGQPGKEKTNETLKFVKNSDSTRLVSAASGWTDYGYGDIKDHHQYPSPLPTPTNEGRLTVLGEFGGLGFFVEGHLWNPEKKWGYRSDATLEASLRRYTEIMGNLARCANETFAASVYTQTTDVETEANGLVTYDRKVAKYPKEVLRALHKRVEKFALSPKALERKVYLPSAKDKVGNWKYTFEAPKDGWNLAGFDTSAWQEGKGLFGNKTIAHDLGAKVNTAWESSDIWLSRTFNLSELPAGNVEMEIFHDEDVDVYLNGELILKKTGYTRGYVPIVLPLEQVKKIFKKGENTLAVHCHNTQGGAAIDLGFYSEPELSKE